MEISILVLRYSFFSLCQTDERAVGLVPLATEEAEAVQPLQSDTSTGASPSCTTLERSRSKTLRWWGIFSLPRRQANRGEEMRGESPLFATHPGYKVPKRMPAIALLWRAPLQKTSLDHSLNRAGKGIANANASTASLLVHVPAEFCVWSTKQVQSFTSRSHHTEHVERFQPSRLTDESIQPALNN